MSGKELLYMITGTLNAKSGTEMYITDDKKLQNISVRSGQYLYLSVHDCWIPVVIRFSPEIGDWIFQNLENINVNGQKRSEEHTSELQSRFELVCRLLL